MESKVVEINIDECDKEMKDAVAKLLTAITKNVHEDGLDWGILAEAEEAWEENRDAAKSVVLDMVGNDEPIEVIEKFLFCIGYEAGHKAAGEKETA